MLCTKHVECFSPMEYYLTCDPRRSIAGLGFKAKANIKRSL